MLVVVIVLQAFHVRHTPRYCCLRQPGMFAGTISLAGAGRG